jgi:hypothetical protein
MVVWVEMEGVLGVLVAMVVVMVVKVDLMAAKVEMEVVTEALVVGLCCMRRGHFVPYR